MTTKPVIGIIAGSGDFPYEIAAAVRASGRDVFVLGLRGFFNRSLRAFPFASVDMLDPQKAIEILRSRSVRDVVLAGGVHRPGPSALLSIYSAYRNRDELRALLGSGDDRLLRGVVLFLEDHQFNVLGVDSVAPSLLAPLGAITQLRAPDHIQPTIRFAKSLLSELGQYDIGQGVVIAGERVLAVEGPEGTDAMILRVRDMQKSKRVKLSDTPAVLVKFAKPHQDHRVDLPAIGPRTIRAAKSAHLAGIVIAAGDVVLVEKDKLISDADRAGMFIEGVQVS